MAAVRPRRPPNDAEAICAAVSRPSMRFLPVKSEDTQAAGEERGHASRSHDAHGAGISGAPADARHVNAMRAHLGEFGIVVPKGIHIVERLVMACEQVHLPAPARKALSLLADQLIDTQKTIEDLTADICADARTNAAAPRLHGLRPFTPRAVPRTVCRFAKRRSLPGIGPITASALVSALPDITGRCACAHARYFPVAPARIAPMELED